MAAQSVTSLLAFQLTSIRQDNGEMFKGPVVQVMRKIIYRSLPERSVPAQADKIQGHRLRVQAQQKLTHA